MNKKVLFFDIDGTLQSEVTKAVPQSAVAAIEKARSLGHLVFINTGRSYSQLGPIQARMEVDGYLCGCGTYIETWGEILYHRVIPRVQAEQIKEAIISCNLEGILEGREGCYYSHKTSRFPIGQELLTHLAGAFKSPGDDNEKSGSFEKFCVITDENSDKAAFFRSLGLGIHVIDRGGGFYECVPAGHSKATAIEVVLDHLKLKLTDAIVFGDSLNDLPMFELVPNAVLMEKHDRELEPFASFRTKTVENDGIAYAMQRLGLLHK